MRTHLLWLLPLTLLGLPAQALNCHECKSTESCYNPTPCNNSSYFCMTTWHTPPGYEVVVIKACAYKCPTAPESLPNSKTSCCNTDLCNSAVSRRASWGLLALGVCCLYLRL
ncbi:lymphocyte antigen 6D-like [Nannospalax galili]|uniref:Lymphocyte antigen 6 family member M n=1 Tax=Nannospalax galili TaxID=1026970 RepID=A0A8C6QS20_NANGA|nr:lymphocyte antigen 6D-like [Nannospalax galili]